MPKTCIGLGLPADLPISFTSNKDLVPFLALAQDMAQVHCTNFFRYQVLALLGLGLMLALFMAWSSSKFYKL